MYDGYSNLKENKRKSNFRISKPAVQENNERNKKLRTSKSADGLITTPNDECANS